MTTRRRAALLTAGYYAVVFAAVGAYLPYWPVWLESRGLDASTIGLFIGAATVVKVAGSTVMPALADRFAIRRGTIAITATLSAALAVGLIFLPAERDLLLGVSLLWTLASTPAVPLGEALGLRAAARHGFAYAPVRAAGSITFLLTNVGVGAALERLGPDVALWTFAAGFLGVALIGWHHPGGGAPAEAGADRAARGEVLGLAMRPAFAIFAAAVAAGQSAHMVYYAYSVLDWRSQGISGSTIGQLWAFGVLVETVLMLGPGRHMVAALGPALALGLGAAAGALRWAAMAAGPEVLWLWPVQAMHALSFGLAHLAAMAFLAAAVPPRLAGSAQGLVAGIAGGGASALVMFAAGGLVAWGGISAAYWMAVGLSGVSAVLALVLAASWRGECLEPGSAAPARHPSR